MKKASPFEIFKVFFIIGIQLLGGGYVIVPLMKKYIVEEHQWMKEDELIDYYAMSQCIPGIIAGNISVCAGYRAGGFIGAVAAILGLISTPFVTILILANILVNIVENPIIQNAFYGIRISVIILILITIKDLWGKSINSKFTYTLFLIILSSLLLLNISPAIIIVLSAITAFLYSRIRKGEKYD